MPRFKDQAICIRHLDWSETSQVVVLMTEQHGKLRGLAKGSKRFSPSSIARFSGGIELLTRGEIVAVAKPTAELATLVEWDLQDNYPHLRRSLPAQRLALYAADLVNALYEEADAHPRAFAALSELLFALVEPTKHQAAMLRFQWELLDDAGFKPELWQDVHTAQPLGEPKACSFDPLGGGLTARAGVNDWRVRWQTVELLRRVANGEPMDDADPQALERANRLLCAYARAILDRELPTMAFLLRAEDRPG